MISVRYVNSVSPIYDDPSCVFEKAVEDVYSELDNTFDKLESIEKRIMFESELLGSAETYLTEAEQKNIFTKIGEAIMAVGKMFVEAINKIIEKIKSLGFKSKTDSEKLEELIKRNPSYANEIKVAFDKGALDLKDIKSLKELNDAWDEIYKMSKRADVDPKSLRGRWNKAMDKFDKDSKTWKVVKVASATTAVISAALAIKTFIPKCKETAQNANEVARKGMEEERQLLKLLENAKPESADYGKLRLLLDIHRMKQNKTVQVYNNRYSILQSLQNRVALVIDKFSKMGAKEYKDNLEANHKRLKEKEANDRKKLMLDEEAKERAKQKVRDESNNKPVSDIEIANIKARTKAQEDAKKEKSRTERIYKKELINIEKKSEAQERGRINARAKSEAETD